MESYEARCGFKRLSTKKPLQLSTVTGSSKDAPHRTYGRSDVMGKM